MFFFYSEAFWETLWNNSSCNWYDYHLLYSMRNFFIALRWLHLRSYGELCKICRTRQISNAHLMHIHTHKRTCMRNFEYNQYLFCTIFRIVVHEFNGIVNNKIISEVKGEMQSCILSNKHFVTSSEKFLTNFHFRTDFYAALNVLLM